MSEMLVEPRPPGRAQRVARLQYGAQSRAAAAAHQPEMTAVLARHQFENGACLAVPLEAEHDAFTAALPAREKYSKIVALWQTEAGQPNEVCHLWAYPDLNARAKARGDAMKDPVWQEFLGKGPAFLEEMHSTIMLPAPHSPLK